VNTLSYKTVSAKEGEVQKEWYVVDATDQVLGRLASRVAMILRGKNKASFTPHVNTGDHVIIINAEKVRLTGNNMQDKKYIRHTGYPGGQREINPADLMKKNPIAVVEKAVKGMLPRTRLGRAIYSKNLHVYAGAEHPHEAQKPKTLDINTIK